jgi:diguanylate cyclase (GGDEF)-like protein
MISRGTLWSKLRQQLNGVCHLGRGYAGRRREVHAGPPALRILSCGLPPPQSDLFRSALAGAKSQTDVTYLPVGREHGQDLLDTAGDHDLLVVGEEALSEGDGGLIPSVLLKHPNLPVLVVVPECKSEAAGESLADGATSYLLANELSGPAVRAAIAEVLREKKLEIEIRMLEEEGSSEQCRDRLTGLLESELAVEFFESEFQSAVRWGTDISCLIIRISRMDSLVQSHGQAFADLIIRNIANLLGRAVRHADVLTRPRADEFLLVLPGATLATSCQRAHQVLGLLSAHQFGLFPPALEVSVHIGVASRMESPAVCAGDLIRFARKMVPSSLEAGARPSVSVWSSLEPPKDEDG